MKSTPFKSSEKLRPNIHLLHSAAWVVRVFFLTVGSHRTNSGERTCVFWEGCGDHVRLLLGYRWDDIVHILIKLLKFAVGSFAKFAALAW